MTFADGVFLMDDDEFVEMESVPYATEDELQTLLELHPSLLAGRLLNPDSPRHFLLIAREAGVPARVDGPDQWSVDHLFVDQDGVPTIVEVKRSVDTRIRREVVGQMLDYAANGLRHWPVDRLRDDLARRVGGKERSDDAVADLLARGGVQEVDPDSFWSQVNDNLSLGRLRLLFVADVIPESLRRIIEFLNEQMDRCEVLGIEIRRYRAGGQHVVVPTVIGHVGGAVRRKSATVVRPFAESLAGASASTRAIELQLATLAQRFGWTVTTDGVSRRYTPSSGTTIAFLYLAGGGAMEFPLGSLVDWGMSAEAAELKAELEIIAGRTLTMLRPWVEIEILLRHWEFFTESWLPRFENAFVLGLQSGEEPAG